MTIQRRHFLKGALSLSAAGILHLPALASPKKPVDPRRIALLADIHIDQDPSLSVRGILPTVHLRTVIEQILAQPKLPVAATICGDCAHKIGLPEDYAMLAKLLKPLRQGGVPIYMLLGNHDNRENLWKAFPDQKKHLAKIPDAQKHAKVLTTENVHLFLLDSLTQPGSTPGLLGKKQLKWIDEKLSTLDDKPVIMMAHHDVRKPPAQSLHDYESLFAIMDRHPQVKGYFFGHLHQWFHQKRNDLWEVCLPATAHVLNKKWPSGWIDAVFQPKGAILTLHTVKKHPQQGEVVELTWRKLKK